MNNVEDLNDIFDKDQLNKQSKVISSNLERARNK